MIRKLIIYDGRHEREVVLAGTIVVGRDPSCHINDLDPLLSRRHAEFVPGVKGVTLRDLGSRNGMLVNGEKVDRRLLVEGDVVQLGHLQLRYVEEQVPIAPEEQARANATTASSYDAKTIAEASQLSGEAARLAKKANDPDATRIYSQPVVEPTFVRSADNPGETFAIPAAIDDSTSAVPMPAPIPLDDPAAEAPTPPPLQLVEDSFTELEPPADPFAPTPAIAPSGMDVTMAGPAPAASDLDATMAGPPHIAGAAAAPSPAQPAAPAPDDATMAGPLDDKLTFARPEPMPAAPPGQPARAVAGPDGRIRTVSVSCSQLLGTTSEHLLGQTLQDLFAEGIQRLGQAGGPATLSFVVERSAADRTLILTITAEQAAEPVP